MGKLGKAASSGGPPSCSGGASLMLGRVGVGERLFGAGPAFAAVVVEQHGLADPGQGGQQLAHGQVQSGVFGFATHEVGDGQGQDAVEKVDPGF